MYVDLDELLRWMEGIERTMQFERDVLQGITHLEIVYEEDLLDAACHQGTIDEVTEYLGVQSSDVGSSLKKVTPLELSDFVANHEEMVRFVGATKYRKYLRS
jgi:hypothetical protein